MEVSPLSVTGVSYQGVLDNQVDGEGLSLSTPTEAGIIEVLPKTVLHFQLKEWCDQKSSGEVN